MLLTDCQYLIKPSTLAVSPKGNKMLAYIGGDIYMFSIGLDGRIDAAKINQRIKGFLHSFSANEEFLFVIGDSLTMGTDLKLLLPFSLWNTNTWEEIKVINKEGKSLFENVFLQTFSPDHKIFAAVGDNDYLYFYLVDTGEIICFHQLEGRVKKLKFSKNGKALYLVIGNKLVVYGRTKQKFHLDDPVLQNNKINLLRVLSIL